MQHIVPTHALVTCDNVSCGVALGVANVQPSTTAELDEQQERQLVTLCQGAFWTSIDVHDNYKLTWGRETCPRRNTLAWRCPLAPES